MTALANSYNTVAAQLAAEVGPERVVATAHRLGITSELTPNPSIALGTSEVTLLELTGAFAPFANGGNGVIPHVIRRIRTVGGEVLFERRGTGTGQVVWPEQLGMMNAMLRETLSSGTAQRAVIEGWQAGGKTGTSQNWRDAWFVGFTAHLVAGIWFGNDDGSPTERATGGVLSAELWSDFMTAAHQGVTPEDLPGNYIFRDPSRFTPYAAPPQMVQGYPVEGGQPVPPMVVGAGPLPPGAVGYPPPPQPQRPGFFRRLFGLD
jgi:penicillin-binding protein 1A